MGEEIKGKVIRGFRFADGVHWHWGDEEVAVINDYNEIEWCKRPLNYPKEVVDIIRSKKEYPEGTWLIEVKKVSISVTQGYYDLSINGKHVMNFGADKVLLDGEYKFSIPDDKLGKLVYNALYHKYDYLYHYSDRIKNIFYPEWNQEKNEGEIKDDINLFIAEVIEIFENFLDDKGYELENPEKEEAIADGEDEESIANIYGTDYGNLQDDIEVILKRWNILQ